MVMCSVLGKSDFKMAYVFRPQPVFQPPLTIEQICLYEEWNHAISTVEWARVSKDRRGLVKLLAELEKRVNIMKVRFEHH